MNTEEIIAVASAISVIFLVVFRFLLSKVQNEFQSFKDELRLFQKDISDKINSLDKSLAVKSHIIDYLHKEIEDIKANCKNHKI